MRARRVLARRCRLIGGAGMMLAVLMVSSVLAQQSATRSTGEAQWIWTADDAPVAYFRRTFFLSHPGDGQVAITADQRYELYVNGRHVGSGNNWRVMDTYDIVRYLVSGRNVIAIKAEGREDAPRGVVARVTVRNAGGTFVSQSTGPGWKAATGVNERWNWPSLNDNNWPMAKSLGEFGRTAPWNDAVRPADGTTASRFRMPEGFAIERVMSPEDTGSVLCMTFDEQGNVLISREGAGIHRLVDTDGDGLPDDVETVNESIKYCHGLLTVNGIIFAVGGGPQGAGLYRLTDEDGDGEAENVELLLEFQGGISEHGPHAPVLGPDGLIYVVIGNHSQVKNRPAATSPYRHIYEGDLVQPKYEDAGGHAVGVKAPGGTIVRTDIGGTFVETYAGGIRNAYDLDFSPVGDLFTYDSDMEWDEGLPWFRTTRFLHVVAGGEYGWRSGWSKWPEYFLDGLPSILETGRGSPTGVVCYDHHAFPDRYRGAFFLGDWSLGRILVAFPRIEGASFAAAAEVFVEGKPLNVTDLAVGPDGALYFCTGGRGTEGGLYRVVYRHAKPPAALGEGIWQAIRQPQFYSAFAREAIAVVQERMGRTWDTELQKVVLDPSNDVLDRIRAMDLMHLYGPYPTPEMLIRLSQDRSASIRAKAAWLMGLHPENIATTLERLLGDPSPVVRRQACESLGRARLSVPADKVIPLLGDERYVAWAARQVLQNMPTAQWRNEVLNAEKIRIFNHGAALLLAIDPSKFSAKEIITQAQQRLPQYMEDDDFVDLLRVVQLALHRADLKAADVPELGPMLAREFPARTDADSPGGHRINRELIRLLVHLQQTDIAERLTAYVASQEPMEDRIHAALYARFLNAAWTPKQRETLLDFYEQARRAEGGYSMSRYIDNVARDFTMSLSDEDRMAVLQEAQRWPSAALGALIKLPEKISPEVGIALQELDVRLQEVDDPAARRLQTAIVAVFARTKDPRAMDYLRAVFEEQPERRPTVAMGLAQVPEGPNLPLLIQALPVLEGPAAVEVLRKLADSDYVPDKPEPTRQVILAGVRLREQGSQYAVALLERWHGEKLGDPNDRWDVRVNHWQKWFMAKYPDQPMPFPPRATTESRWTMEEVLGYLNDEKSPTPDPRRGAIVFEKAQCAKCHRFGRVGESAGPDLTTVARRFHQKEILESILHPSQVISDQYASKTVITVDGHQLTGVLGSAGPNTYSLLLPTGEKIEIAHEDVEEIEPSRVSVMPEGLLNNFTLEDIADLMAFLSQSSAPVASAPGQRR